MPAALVLSVKADFLARIQYAQLKRKQEQGLEQVEVELEAEIGISSSTGMGWRGHFRIKSKSIAQKPTPSVTRVYRSISTVDLPFIIFKIVQFLLRLPLSFF